MAAYCTCGIQLVEDARFCHKCGRPVRPEYAEAEEQNDRVDLSAAAASSRRGQADPMSPPPLPHDEDDGDEDYGRPQGDMPPAALPEIGFQNKVAVRIALVLAGPMYVLFNFLAVLPAGIFLAFLGLVATGFLAVLLYRKRTGVGLSVISGARMGWIAGVFIFVIALVVVTLTFALASSTDLSQFVQDVKKQQGNSADVERAVELLSSPAAVLMMIVLFFVMFTTLPSLGGALGAKLLDSKESSGPA